MKGRNVDLKTERKIKVIELQKPHTHAGRDYPEGAKLDLEVVKMDQDSAAWLVSVGTAMIVE